jgi:two-component system, LytTR family, sensor kinase
MDVSTNSRLSSTNSIITEVFNRKEKKIFADLCLAMEIRSFSSKRNYKLYLWLSGLWLFLWLAEILLNQPEVLMIHTRNEVWRIIYLALVNYLFFEYCLPVIIRKRESVIINVAAGIFLIMIFFLFLSLGLFGWISLGILLKFYTQFRFSHLAPNGPYYKLLDSVFYEAGTGLISLVYFGVAKLLHYNFKLRQAAQQLRLEKQDAELNFLKSQTNPHFLFNTLNSIYSLSRDKSDIAPEAILRLSKILRFMLYETSKELISVEKEIEVITDYIELEKLRYDESLKINFTYEIEDMNTHLPPLLLIPLVENAFKHGASETSGQSLVHVDLSIKKEVLLFVVKNSIESIETDVKENIGLTNLRRQLQLLYTDYSLNIQPAEKTFTASLKINLTSHV